MKSDGIELRVLGGDLRRSCSKKKKKDGGPCRVMRWYYWRLNIAYEKLGLGGIAC